MILQGYHGVLSWTDVGVLRCPSAPKQLPQNPPWPLLVTYAYNEDIWSGDKVTSPGNRAFPADKSPGMIPEPTRTVLAGDGWKDAPDWWYYGRGYYWFSSGGASTPFDPGHWLTSSHANERMNILFVDGHVDVMDRQTLPKERVGIWTVYDND